MESPEGLAARAGADRQCCFSADRQHLCSSFKRRDLSVVASLKGHGDDSRRSDRSCEAPFRYSTIPAGRLSAAPRCAMSAGPSMLFHPRTAKKPSYYVWHFGIDRVSLKSNANDPRIRIKWETGMKRRCESATARSMTHISSTSRPAERSELSHWRQRLGGKLDLLLADSLRIEPRFMPDRVSPLTSHSLERTNSSTMMQTGSK